MKRLNIAEPGFEQAFRRIVNDRRESDPEVSQDVATIIERVRSKGDEALAEYTQRFDDWQLTEEPDWLISGAECREAWDALDTGLREALQLSAGRISAVHVHQLPSDRYTTVYAGVRLGSRCGAAKW
jgi:histidinol dehydrogenase